MREVSLCSFYCFHGDPGGGFRASGERQWLMTPIGESWTPSQADFTVSKANPPAHSTVSHRWFAAELGLGIGVSQLQNGETRTRLPRRSQGWIYFQGPASHSPGHTQGMAPPYMLHLASCLCAFASTVSSNWSPFLHLPSSVSQALLSLQNSTIESLLPRTILSSPSFNSGKSVSLCAQGLWTFIHTVNIY